jgi:hypothetical protein
MMAGLPKQGIHNVLFGNEQSEEHVFCQEMQRS